MTTETTKREHLPVQELDRVTIRFVGDSGDGMQLTGTQFTRTAAAFGNDISTFPDYPAEIRAPAGSIAAFGSSEGSTRGLGAAWDSKSQSRREAMSTAIGWARRKSSPSTLSSRCGRRLSSSDRRGASPMI